jgi:hypothetical protein
MKSNGKFTYTRYDYSFLRPEPSFWEQIAERVYAKTIGTDLTTVKPMNEPVGQLFWFDPIITTDTGPSKPTIISSRQQLIDTYEGYRARLRAERTREYFKRKNYFKKIRNR